MVYKYIVHKKTRRVVDRFVAKLRRGYVHPSEPVLMGSWTIEYPTEDYAYHESKRELTIGRSKVRIWRKK
jgi:hypothetical protein